METAKSSNWGKDSAYSPLPPTLLADANLDDIFMFSGINVSENIKDVCGSCVGLDKK